MNQHKTTILALSWRDIRAPKAGGAEVHTHEMLKRIDKDKYRVIHFSPLADGLPSREEIDGVTYLRKGNVISVIWYAMRYYKRHAKDIDYVIDQCNTHRFFTPLWVEPQKRIFFIHQLTKEIWDYSAKFPLSKIGKMSEEWMLRLNKKDVVITVSDSTRQELIDRGYDPAKITIIHNGVSFTPWLREQWCPKETNPTFIYVGRYSPYKGIDVAVEAFATLRQEYPNAKLWIMGKKDQEYVDRYLMPICNRDGLRWDEDIISLGYVTEEKKLELLSRSWALLFPSIREGWGIPVTEAGCVGTPCIAFDSPGIREAVDYGKAGYLCQGNTVNELYLQMKLVLEDRQLYNNMQEQAYGFSSQFLWENTGKEVNKFLERMKTHR